MKGYTAFVERMSSTERSSTRVFSGWFPPCHAWQKPLSLIETKAAVHHQASLNSLTDAFHPGWLVFGVLVSALCWLVFGFFWNV